MLLFLSLSGILLSSILLFFNASKYRSSIYLGIYFFTISLYGLVQYILLYSGSVFLCSIAEIHFSALFYLPGPMLYLYVRSVVTDDSRLRWSDLFHLLPTTVFLIAALPYIFSSFSHKLEIGREIVNDPGFIGIHNHTILAKIFSNAAIFISRPLLLLGYSVMALYIFFRFLLKKNHLLTFRNQSFMLKWLSFFLGFQTILIIAHLLMMIETFIGDTSNLFFTINIFQVLSAIGLTGLLITPFLFPEILYGLPRYPETILATARDIKFQKEPPARTEIARNSLDTVYIARIEQRIASCMVEFNPYCEPDFSMASFASLTGIPSHHLSLYLNTVKGQSFSDFRNKYRVNHAKQLIIDGRLKEMTIESIGISSGFANRATFYRVFKNSEGISPGDFAAKVSKEG